MAERQIVYIPWTIENWITILLMVGLGFGLLAIVSQFWQNRQSNAG